MPTDKPASSETPRTDRLESGIETRRAARGFYMPEDVVDLLVLARQLECDLAEETRNKKQFERDWLEARDQIDALKSVRLERDSHAFERMRLEGELEKANARAHYEGTWHNKLVIDHAQIGKADRLSDLIEWYRRGKDMAATGDEIRSLTFNALRKLRAHQNTVYYTPESRAIVEAATYPSLAAPNCSCGYPRFGCLGKTHASGCKPDCPFLNDLQNDTFLLREIAECTALTDAQRQFLHRLAARPSLAQVGWIPTEERLPDVETQVLVKMFDGKVRFGELRWRRPTYEETFPAFLYFDDPTNDGQDWDWFDITHWTPMPGEIAPSPLVVPEDGETPLLSVLPKSKPQHSTGASILSDDPTEDSLHLLAAYWPNAGRENLTKLYTNLLACGKAASYEREPLSTRATPSAESLQWADKILSRAADYRAASIECAMELKRLAGTDMPRSTRATTESDVSPTGPVMGARSGELAAGQSSAVSSNVAKFKAYRRSINCHEIVHDGYATFCFLTDCAFSDAECVAKALTERLSARREPPDG